MTSASYERKPKSCCCKVDLAGQEQGMSCVAVVSLVCEISILKGNYMCQKKGTS
jgi:hypothetical protein